jgi:Uma2 family endonuclease
MYLAGMSAPTLDRMSATSWPPHPDALGFTVADLHALPDDGLRYELIDGSIIVSPSATFSHNMIAVWIANEITAASPSKEWIVGTDQSASVDDRNEPRPDIVVSRTRHMLQSPFPIASASLVVEVVSPHSGLRDKQTKRGLYARAKVPAYWIVDPDEEKGVISLAEMRLDGGAYRDETANTAEVFETDHPWPVRIDLPEMSREWREYLDYVD